MSIEIIINLLEEKASGSQSELEFVRGLLEQARTFKASRGLPSMPSPGQFRGFKPWQAIKEYLKMRDNPGVSQEEIVKALENEGTVLTSKKYPKRSVSLAIANSPTIFEEREGLVHLVK
jgi:hypothetical protein